MAFRNASVLLAILALGYGIGFELAPAAITSVYGVATNSEVELLARYFGIALLGLGVVAWLIRNTTDQIAQHAMIWGSFVLSVVGIAVSVQGTLAGTMNALGWGNLVIYLAIIVAFFSALRQMKA